MYDIAQYQLFKSAQLASPHLDSLDYSKLDKQLDIESYLTDMDESVLKLSKKKITKAQFNKNTKLLTDRILLTNKGLSKQKNLGMIWHQCEKELVVATLLLRRNYNQAGLQLCFSILKRSKKYMFIDLSYRASLYALKFAYKLERKSLYKKIKIEYNKFKKYKLIADDLENRDRDFFFEHKEAGGVLTKKSLAILDETLYKYKDLLHKAPSYRIQMTLSTFLIISHISKKNYDQAIIFCTNSLTWYKNNLPNLYPPIGSLNIRTLELYILNKNYNEGAKFIKLLPKRPKYLVYQELRELFLSTILMIRAGQYMEAYNLHKLSKKKSSPTAVKKDFSDYYILTEAYIHLLIETESISVDNARRFKIQKLINDLPNFERDKETNNISLIIAKFSFLVVRKKYKDCLQFALALDKYKQRYLNKPYHKRYKLFIQMLIEIPKSGFNKKSVERKTKKSLTQLREVQVESIYVPYTLEIIPYEVLWDMLSKGLSDRHYFYEEEAEIRAERAKLLKAM